MKHRSRQVDERPTDQYSDIGGLEKHRGRVLDDLGALGRLQSSVSILGLSENRVPHYSIG